MEIKIYSYSVINHSYNIINNNGYHINDDDDNNNSMSNNNNNNNNNYNCNSLYHMTTIKIRITTTIALVNTIHRNICM